MATDTAGRVHGWQFKDMTGPEPSPIAGKSVQRIFKSIHQPLDSNADVQTLGSSWQWYASGVCRPRA
ncbi:MULTISPECIES: hypothetical protein [Streptomyces]|uniref:hypothetical protein n=1 Tax=Streptomyces TaxID=1883 RepID=UPI000AD83071|nr:MULTISPECIES: hypothetical protein [Streptomyces]